MDLMDLTPKSETIVVTIKHPTIEKSSKEYGKVLKNDDGSDMTITVYAPHSKEYKKIVHEQTNKRIAEMQESGKTKLSSEDLAEAELETLAQTTKEWNITFGGDTPKLSVEKAKEVYEKVFWIKSQVDEAIEDSLDFMRA